MTARKNPSQSRIPNHQPLRKKSIHLRPMKGKWVMIGNPVMTREVSSWMRSKQSRRVVMLYRHAGRSGDVGKKADSTGNEPLIQTVTPEHDEDENPIKVLHRSIQSTCSTTKTYQAIIVDWQKAFHSITPT